MLFSTECFLGFLKYFKRASLFTAVIIVSALIITIPKVAFRVFMEAPWVASVLDFRNVSAILLVVFIAASKAASVTASVIVRVFIVVMG